ncbi:MAG: hypothetical protein ACKOYN_01410 [Planctomycetota bacterium]
MTTHTLCPKCHYVLDAVAGGPAEPLGAFTADALCPECGEPFPAGTHVISGSSRPFPSARRLPLARRMGLGLAFGGGCGATVLHVVAGLGAWLLVLAAMDMARGGIRYQSGIRLFGLLASVVALGFVARFWWKRRPADSVEGVRVDERDRWMTLGPGGLRDGTRILCAEEVRAVHVYECLDAGEGRTVVAVNAHAMTRLGTLTASGPVYLPISSGTTHRFADALMASLRGRAAPHASVGEEFTGRASLPRFRRRWLVPVGAFSVLPLLVFGLVIGGIIGWVLALLPVLMLALAVDRDTILPEHVWRAHRDGMVIGTRIPLGVQSFWGRVLSSPLAIPGQSAAVLESSAVVAIPHGARLELRETHGMHYLALRGPHWWSRTRRLIPDDWLGMAPEAFARGVADALRVPFANRVKAAPRPR